MREGGGEPGKPPKQPKKRKKAFSEKKETAAKVAPSKIFQKTKKRLITNVEKRPDFEF